MPTYQARKAGIYRATYTGCSERTFTNKETGEDEIALLWRFQSVDDPLTTGEMSKWTRTSLRSPNSNAHILAAGVMGRKLQPGDDTETMVGELYDVVYGPNQAGNLAITSVVKVAATPAPLKVIPPDPENDLPERVGVLPDLP